MALEIRNIPVLTERPIMERIRLASDSIKRMVSAFCIKTRALRKKLSMSAATNP